jgi:hypothetical protein
MADSTPALPPIDPNAIIQTAQAVLTRPAEFYPTVKSEQGFNKVLVFAIAMGVVYGALNAVGAIIYLHSIAAAIIALVVGAITGVLAPFLGGAIVHVICMVLGSKAQYESSVKVAGYASAIYPAYGLAALLQISWALQSLVWLASGLYGLYIVYLGARALNFDAASASPPASPPAPPPPAP